jgi:hypothetical protein
MWFISHGSSEVNKMKVIYYDESKDEYSKFSEEDSDELCEREK